MKPGQEHHHHAGDTTGTDLERGTGSAAFIPIAQFGAADPAELDLEAIRRKLAGARGRQLWTSLEEVAETPGFQRYMEREFPHQAPRDMAPLPRRDFIRLMGATMALAGIGGCAYQAPEKIVPYLEQPENLIPGKSTYYTTAFERGGYGIGLLAESSEGRPVKLEGNPDHVASLGATDAIAQASLLQLYDPDRSQAVRHHGEVSAWEIFLGEFSDKLLAYRKSGGSGLRFLVGPTSSPTLLASLARVKKVYPQAVIHQYRTVGPDAAIEGARLAFGTALEPVYDFSKAERIVSLDANFFEEEAGSVRYARDFARGRRLRDGRTEMNRLYVFESNCTITGGKADHRVPVAASSIDSVARAIARQLGVTVSGGESSPISPSMLAGVVEDLRSHRGKSLVLAGAHQPPAVHAVALAINAALGNIGATVNLVEPICPAVGAGLKPLVEALRGQKVQTLFILGCNPVYDSPAELGFLDALQQARGGAQFIHMGLYDDETGVECQWHLPQSHYLEAWGDTAAYDGTVSLIQPLIRPLYSTRSIPELLAEITQQPERTGYDIVRAYWQSTNPAYSVPGTGFVQGRASTRARPLSAAFEKFWHSALVSGVVAGTRATPGGPTAPAPSQLLALPETAHAAAGVDLVLRPDPTVWDGSFANNPWLQELPKPITKLTWDNALLVSPKLAQDKQLQDGDVVELTVGNRKLKAAVRLVPGHADGSVTLSLGYGRTRAGKVAEKTGFNAYALRTSDHPGIAGSVDIRKTGERYDIVQAQEHFRLEGRDFDLFRRGNLEQLNANPVAPEFMQAHAYNEHEVPHEPGASLYPPTWPSDRKDMDQPGAGTWEGDGYNGQPIPAWGMVIDNTACVGCNACTIACQAENNIATVGKDQVKINREMHWIRIDTYFGGELDNPEVFFEPVMCQHCEKAPCEPVCPVEATSHSAEGLNEMTYNRCVGTRYCSNNCPYKVRRFNFLQFSDQITGTFQLMRNPDVTVRSRGVMEKCSYCVQRITGARIEAEKEERLIRDGDVKTACQQVCPTEAIIFGNINDRLSHGGKGSHVRQMKESPLNFTLLTPLNTRPRSSYLAAVKNPNPAISGPAGSAGGSHEGH